MRVTVIDFETNGFQGSEVLSFSYAHHDNDWTPTFNESRYYYPRGEYNEKAIAVNGLTEEKITKLRGDADYPRHYDEDVEFIASVLERTDVIVAHNIAFDYSFLPHEVIPKNCQVFCTMKANTKYFDKNPKLKEAAEYYGIEVAEESLHGSAYDVELCLAIYNAMKEEDKEPNDDFLSKVYAARDEYGNMIHPFGKWKGWCVGVFSEKDCEEFLGKYNGSHTHEMYDAIANKLDNIKIRKEYEKNTPPIKPTTYPQILEDVENWKWYVTYSTKAPWDADENETIEVCTQHDAKKLYYLLKAMQKKISLLSPYAQMFSDERHRQITEERWTPEHDDEHVNGELADAAACYAMKKAFWRPNSLVEIFPVWPATWDEQWLKKRKHKRKRQLIIAGALLIAELERLDRAEQNQKENS